MNHKSDFRFFNWKPNRVEKKGMVSILTVGDKKYVAKKKKKKINSFHYLETRNFHHFPTIYSTEEDDYELMEYIEDFLTPKEQKLQDIIYLTSILHIKTTFYKQVDLDFIKNIYETLLEKQTVLYHYYEDLQNMIELEEYMSPANYLLIRNISMVYTSIRKSNQYLEKWYEEVQKEKKMRYVYIHGNLQESHLLENEDLYLISWDQSRIDLPIYDLETFYRNSFMDIRLEDILSIYENKYPLKIEEYDLLIAFLLLPNKIKMTNKEYSKTKEVTSLILYLDKIFTFLENNSKKTKNYQNHQE